MNIDQLNESFAISGHISFTKGTGGLPVANISNQYADAVISLYGAHVLSYQPKGGKDVLWVSPQSAFEEGKPIRGGIPVCFPWFGGHPSISTQPVHGFARLLVWHVTDTNVTAQGETQIHLSLTDTAATKAIWDHSFKLEFTVTVGKSLNVVLNITNTGTEAFTITDALHSYFNVSDSSKIEIEGLGGEYYDGTAKDAVTKQTEPLLKLAKEENRRYFGHTADTIIHDAGFGRKVRVGKNGSKITVIWNPWEATTKNIGDIPDAGYLNFVCIEPANAYTDTTSLAPSATHIISTSIAVE